MPFGFGGHPTPRRRQAVEAYREVLVHIDERPAKAAPRSSARPTSSRSSKTAVRSRSGGGGRTRQTVPSSPLPPPPPSSSSSPSRSSSGRSNGSGIFTPKIRNYRGDDAAAHDVPVGDNDAGDGDGDGDGAGEIEYLSLPELRRRNTTCSSRDDDVGDDGIGNTSSNGQPSSDFVIGPRVSSRGRDSVGSGGADASVASDSYHDDDDNNHDDSSVRSTLEEVFESALMKVSFTGGVVTLEYPQEKEEEEEAEEEEEQAIPIAMAVPSEEDSDYDYDYSDSDDDAYYSQVYDSALHALPPLAPPLPRNEPRFELQSTNIHSAEDERQRKKNEIRLAVLDAAAKAYKDANIDVPDVLLAQINECRSSAVLRDRRGPGAVVGAVVSAMATASAAQSRKNSSADHKELAPLGSQQISVMHGEGPNSPINAAATIKRQDSEVSRDSAPATENEATPKAKVQRRVRKLRIGRDDEIHVPPCQCAFKLVGMQGFSILGPTLEDRAANGEEEQIFSQSSHDVLRTPTRRRSSLPASIQQSAPARVGRRALPVLTPVRSNVTQSSSDLSALGMTMAKTRSGQAATPRSPSSTTAAIAEVMHHPASPDNGSPPLKLGGPVEASTSSKLTEYHEITLIRKASPPAAHEDEDEEFIDWDALTLRCKDHDEMDAIISSFKTSARAHIVPFSPDPRAKLKKKKEQQARERLKKRRSGSRRRLHTSSDKSLEAIDIQPTPSDSQRRVNMTSPLTPPSSERGPVRSPSNRNQRKERRRGESKNFNKTDYCECCGFQFTLLTRRHHCRKCDRSCCGDCSSLIIVRGGEERRFCNRCSVGVIRKQSKSLNRRLSGYAGDMSTAILPGKVHHECFRYGVNVFGKLPHWKNYIAWDRARRPAVGRITCEVIEAMALPHVDVSGKSDPYVVATITGYDRDMRFNVKEWSTKFALSTGYCSGTLAPIWRGSGRKGGELLTLPVISTAGAVLRLEVMHFDHMTHSRGKDTTLGVVEIPLSDFPNANLRKAESEGLTYQQQKKQNNCYDGFVDRWYRLRLPSGREEGDVFVLSKPIPDPLLPLTDNGEKGAPGDADGEGRKRSKNKNVGLRSLREIGERFQRISTAPIEWIGTALRIDVPRRPEAGAQRKSRAAIHIRVKLNTNEIGDLLSHTWFPPVEPYPAMPKYDPQILFNNIMRVSRKLSPYQKRWKFIEDAIKWRHPPKICVLVYTVFAVHLALFPYFLFAAHVYLYIFLWTRLRQMKDRPHTLERIDSFDATLFQTASNDDEEEDDDDATVGDDASRTSDSKASRNNSKATIVEESKIDESPSLNELSKANEDTKKTNENGEPTDKGRAKNVENEAPNTSSTKVNEEEVAKLNKAVEWIAKRVGQDRGLEKLQFKLGMLGKDLTKLNAIWDGSSVLKTRVAMIVLIVSFTLHIHFNHRILWLVGTAVWFFGFQCPASKRAGRSFIGAFSGVAKVVRRRQLHDAEVKPLSEKK